MFDTDEMRELVRVNRQFIREEAQAAGDMETVAEMDAADARDREYVEASSDSKAHAYIRSLERTVEEERVRSSALAVQLERYRAWLASEVNRLAAVTASDFDRWTDHDQEQALRGALKRLDEITGKGE